MTECAPFEMSADRCQHTFMLRRVALEACAWLSVRLRRSKEACPAMVYDPCNRGARRESVGLPCAICGARLNPGTEVYRAGVDGPTCGRADLCAVRAVGLLESRRARRCQIAVGE